MMRLFLLSLSLSLLLLCLSLTGWQLYQQLRAPAWPQANAQIQDSGLAKAPLWPGRYYLRVNYSYQIDETTYSRQQLNLSPWHWPLEAEEAQRLNRLYPPGKWVTVHYHPQRPHLAIAVGADLAVPMWQWSLCLLLLLLALWCARPWLQAASS